MIEAPLSDVVAQLVERYSGILKVTGSSQPKVEFFSLKLMSFVIKI